MEQSAATALYTIEPSNLEIAAMLLIMAGLVVAIIGSLALLAKRNQNFISDFTSINK
jgi:UPF0716 family protein affecting phage T7 exclusion